jgi:hypothetical protein
MTRHVMTAICLLLIAGCMVGGNVKKYQPAQGPAGATVELRMVDKSFIRGELLAIEDSSLVVLRDSVLNRVALSSVKEGRAPSLSFAGSRLSSTQRDRLRLISRFPQGISAELEPRLLSAYGQSSIQSVP